MVTLHPWSLRSFSQVSLEPLAVYCGFSLLPGEVDSPCWQCCQGQLDVSCSGGSGRDQAMYGWVCIAGFGREGGSVVPTAHASVKMLVLRWTLDRGSPVAASTLL